jgi:hypothetical protein
MRGLPQIHSFVFATNQFDWPTTQKKKKKLWKLPKIKGFIFKYRVSPLGPMYKGEGTTTFAKAYGIKVRCYGEHVGEHTRNPMGT